MICPKKECLVCDYSRFTDIKIRYLDGHKLTYLHSCLYPKHYDNGSCKYVYLSKAVTQGRDDRQEYR